MNIIPEYASYDALGLAELIRTRAVTPGEVLEAAVGRLHLRNPIVNAVVTPMFDQAQARIADGLPAGPLSGVPFLLKDLYQLYTGARTTNGSRLFADYVADHDTTYVARLRAGGVLVIGKTNTPELGLSPSTEPALHGPTRNPWALDRSAGGSSGGSAAAVACRIEIGRAHV